jgi:hypothetical protein
MDSRDFDQEPKKVYDGRYLEEIYSLQKELIDGYVKIEGLPPYPLDVNTKKSQVLIKDFVGRVIEELAEGYESLIQVDEIIQANAPWNLKWGQEKKDNFIQCINHLQNAGEEMADAMHFMVELLIYCNIQPEDICRYTSRYSNKLTEFAPDNAIAKSMIVGKAQFQEELTFPDDKNCVNLITLAYNLRDDYELNIEIPDERLLQFGSNYNQATYGLCKSMMWDVTYHLNIARNFLKNKPWKQSQMMTNEAGFQEEIVKGFICMMGLFYTMGITDENLYFIYFRKNLTNKFRQKSNY